MTFTVTELTQITERKRHGWAYPAVDLSYYNTELLCKIYLLLQKLHDCLGYKKKTAL